MDHSETSRTGTGSAPLHPGRETTLDLSKVFDATVLAMAALAEPGEGGNHIVRMQHFVRALAHKLKASPVYGRPMSDVAIALLFRAVPLHDIGNSGIPDRILLKPGPLDSDEILVMRKHTRIGCAVIDQIKAGAGLSTQFLEVARDIVACHHEHWDGTGYPQGLVGEAIPLVARITALADTYDALTSARVYRSGVPHDRAVQLIFQERAAHFDPDMVDAFIEIQDEYASIAERFSDSDGDLQRKMDYMAMAIAETP
ncbi:MAG: HD domain-containing phosphohydrolase [Burkholderiaceae bacterium]